MKYVLLLNIYTENVMKNSRISDVTFTGNNLLRIDFLQPAKRCWFDDEAEFIISKSFTWIIWCSQTFILTHSSPFYVRYTFFFYPSSLMFLQRVITRDNSLRKWHPQFSMGQETAKTEIQNSHYVILYQ